MRKKIDFLAILIVVLLIVSLCAAGLAVYLDRAYQDSQSSGDALECLIDDLERAANLGGAPAVEDFPCEAYGLWENVDENFNAVLVDENGDILAQTGALVCGDMPALNMLLARYDRPIEVTAQTGADDSVVHRTIYGRLGLLLDENGQTIARFVADCGAGDVPLKTDGVPTATYVERFPSLDAELYARMTTGAYGEEQTFVVGEKDLAQVEAYLRWENEEVARVGELRSDIRPLTGAFAGRMLVAFYLDNAELRSMDASREQLRVWAVEAVTWALVLYVAFSLLLAVWVFRDARKRDFLPAMWGLLTLIGNVVAWLVYMLVRSRGAGRRCERCDTPLCGDFVYCPACGARARGGCPGCGHGVEEGWKVCPYCGAELPEEDDGAPGDGGDAPEAPGDAPEAPADGVNAPEPPDSGDEAGPER